MLDRMGRIDSKQRVHLVLGVRNNTTMFLHKEFLLDFFKRRPDCNLSVAVSRELKDEQYPENVAICRGRVQDILRRFDLEKWQLQESAIS